MIHPALLLLAILIGWSLRARPRPASDWSGRWQSALARFLTPFGLLLTSALTLVWMGTPGAAAWQWQGQLAYGAAGLWLGFALLCGLVHTWRCARTIELICHLPVATIAGERGRLIDAPGLYIAQVGFWRPQLVFSRGLSECLRGDQLAAVLAHEQAHCHYRDPFWFFWLGWVRRATFFYPGTEALWQELLLLRELRADRRAALHVDSLSLAETLLLLARSASAPAEPAFAATMYSAGARLGERVDALLAAPQPPSLPLCPLSWAGWLLLGLLPLATWPLHTLAIHGLCP
ncbi:M56 family metallopeptidase [Gloeobacter kilaueensis]|uniref:Zn-dependent protease with chaperone function n=1 Tax=Gloeobacter kilaueensis (strain ATCC BAA-2537 / CCAP 1431/1 / ULC 316 / JS1) TaxID=1183438 RepID=U5QKP6_GLOK1|nr:M56 family metallopeptidase [Gloeobacter kilaueensis]AGY58189.1 Zn-dependent protease with chaperone function [Gloeobacter kilaueensis JS1]